MIGGTSSQLRLEHTTTVLTCEQTADDLEALVGTAENEAPTAANSVSSHPAPDPEDDTLPESRCSVATCYATTYGLRIGNTSTDVPSRIRVVRAARNPRGRPADLSHSPNPTLSRIGPPPERGQPGWSVLGEWCKSAMMGE